MTDAKDKDGWPIVPGARVAAERGYLLTRTLPAVHTAACQEWSKVFAEKFEMAPRPDCACPRATEQYAPTDDCIVLRVEQHQKHGPIVVLRNLPLALRVQKGDTKKSQVYREMTDESYRAVSKARRKREVA
jgi:hypothetical protein